MTLPPGFSDDFSRAPTIFRRSEEWSGNIGDDVLKQLAEEGK